jgi:hypothetical protein
MERSVMLFMQATRGRGKAESAEGAEGAGSAEVGGTAFFTYIFANFYKTMII